MAPSPPTPSKPCYFLKLPSELRLNIYEIVYSLEALHAKTPDLNRKIQPALLYTCHEIYGEARPAFDAQISRILRNCLEKLDIAKHMMQMVLDDADERIKVASLVDLTEVRKLGDVTQERGKEIGKVIELAAEARD